MRRLTVLAAAPPPADLARPVQAILNARLLTDDPRPVAVALSGGSDSLALLLIAADWAARARRPLTVLTVDHRLQLASGDWTRTCAATARRLGAGFQALAWDGDKPTAGLPAAARAARHRLLADAARAIGAQVVLMGHTADDRREAQAMRAAGATTPDPRQWAPSPAWPQGRGIFLLRPLIVLGRADLRAWLAARGETWIDDPANDDLRSPRARARRQGGACAPPAVETPATLAGRCVAEPGGGLSIARDALRAAGPAEAQRFLALATVCAGGGDRRPATRSLARAALALAADGDFTGVLAGARIAGDAGTVRILREPGEIARGGLQPLRLAPGQTGVWDGRFEITASRDVEVRALASLASRLPDAQARALRLFPAKARGGLPAVVHGDVVASPLLGPTPAFTARDLVHGRLRAAAGLVDREPA